MARHRPKLVFTAGTLVQFIHSQNTQGPVNRWTSNIKNIVYSIQHDFPPRPIQTCPVFGIVRSTCLLVSDPCRMPEWLRNLTKNRGEGGSRAQSQYTFGVCTANRWAAASHFWTTSRHWAHPRGTSSRTLWYSVVDVIGVSYRNVFA